MTYNKLLLVGSNSIHLFNYHKLIAPLFNSITVITNGNSYTYDNSIITYFGYKNIFRFFKSLIFIRKNIQKLRPDFIHIHQINVYAFVSILASLGLKIPIILTAWGDDVLVNPHKNYLLRKIVLFCLKHTHIITSDSLYMSYEIAKLLKGNAKKVSTINFGIELKDNNLQKENIIYSNRLHHGFYRIDKIIKAFDVFYKNHKNWQLVIAGAGPETPHLQKLASSLPSSEAIKIVGWTQKEVNDSYYQKAKIYISIPTTDATSVSLLEALSFGCVPIVSNLPANLEWVMEGINGKIIHNCETDFISDALNIDFMYAHTFNNNLIKTKALKEHSFVQFKNMYDSLKTVSCAE